MPGWGEILEELQATISPANPGGDLDGLRKKYIDELHRLSGRAVIVYSSGWLSGRTATDTAVLGDDVHSMMEVCRDVSENELDLNGRQGHPRPSLEKPRKGQGRSESRKLRQVRVGNKGASPPTVYGGLCRTSAGNAVQAMDNAALGRLRQAIAAADGDEEEQQLNGVLRLLGAKIPDKNQLPLFGKPPAGREPKP